jgi:uncharacterized protein YecE (DUF72 family)
MANPNYYSGLSGIELPVPKYQFPPEHQNSSRLTYYSTIFNSIEINSSFYKIPMTSTISRWVSSVPEHFKFTFKLFREITHVKDLNFDNSHIEKFIRTMSEAGSKKGCLLVQFPPSLKNHHIHQLDALLNDIKIADPAEEWNVAVEFRDQGWYNEDVFAMLESYNIALVIHDIPKSAAPLRLTSSDFIYVRFHGPTGNYSGSYGNAFLQEYAAYIREWLDDGKKVYVYFNNTKGDAYNNLRTLNSFVAQ